MKLHTAVLYSPNVPESVSYYTENIGLKVEDIQGGNFASLSFDGGDSRIGIKLATTEREIPGNQTVIISVSDIDQFHEQISKSLQNVPSVVTQPWGRTFTVYDNCGNKIEFLES